MITFEICPKFFMIAMKKNKTKKNKIKLFIFYFLINK